MFTNNVFQNPFAFLWLKFTFTDHFFFIRDGRSKIFVCIVNNIHFIFINDIFLEFLKFLFAQVLFKNFFLSIY